MGIEADPIYVTFADIQVVKYCNVSSLAVFVFDYCLTFGAEVQTIWRHSTSWSLTKILFVIVRYVTFVDVPLVLLRSLDPDISPHECYINFCLATALTIFAITASEGIMMVRTYALWGCDRRAARFMIGAFIICLTGCWIIYGLFISTLKYAAPPTPELTGCFPIQASIVLFGEYALVISFETMILIMTIWRGVTMFRDSPSPLVKTLYQDGVVYFVGLFTFSLANIIVMVAYHRSHISGGLFNGFQRTFHSIFAARIILHLRQVEQEKDPATATAAMELAGFVDEIENRSAASGEGTSA